MADDAVANRRRCAISVTGAQGAGDGGDGDKMMTLRSTLAEEMTAARTLPEIHISSRGEVPRRPLKPPAKESSLLRLDDRQFASPREWLVDGLLERRGALLLVAEEGQGKSTLAVAMAAAVASGHAFFGKKAALGLVIYVATEKAREAGRRLRVAVPAEHHHRIRLMTKSPFIDEKSLAEFLSDAKEFERDENEQIKLVVVDTAGRAIGDSDENSTRDANRFIEKLDEIRRRTGAAITLVHHARRAEGRSRGSQVFPAWADGVAIIERTKAGRVLRLIKSNVADEGATILFAIEARPIDPENEAAGTVAVAVPAVVGERRKAQSRPLTGDAALALTLLTPGAAPIPLEEWRKQCVSKWKKPNATAARVAWHSLIDPSKSRLLREGYISIERNGVRALAGVSEALANARSEGALGVSSAPSPLGERERAANANATPRKLPPNKVDRPRKRTSLVIPP